jgi:FKBP-type peptidyl-prolyl cis-trans isomerase SlyD
MTRPMDVQANRVVAIDYTLKGDDGQVIDSSDGREPLYYLHGHQNIVEGLEKALEGKNVGDFVEVSVPPEQGYGTRDESRVFEVPKTSLPEDLTPTKGMVLHMSSPDGGRLPVTVTKVKLKSIEVDANHELADKTLHFSVTIKEVRKATKDEMTHGHAHGPGGHHHH